MNRLFRILIASIYSKISTKAKAIATGSLSRTKNIDAYVLAELNEKVAPLMDDLFKEGVKISNLIVKQEVANLAANYKLPIKYNKDLILTFNSNNSIFTGFYDNAYKTEFTKGEIRKMKSVILNGNYSNWSEKKMITEIQNVVKASDNKARLIARNETARLNTAAQSIYYKESKVKEAYDKVWIAQVDARDEHKAMNGQIADQDGWFTTPSGTKCQGPPQPDSPYNCRCSVDLRKKEIEQ